MDEFNIEHPSEYGGVRKTTAYLNLPKDQRACDVEEVDIQRCRSAGGVVIFVVGSQFRDSFEPAVNL